MMLSNNQLMELRKVLQWADLIRAVSLQQEMCERYGGADWDLYKKDEIKLLTEKVSLLISPENESNPTTKEYIQKLCKVIIKEGTHVCDLKDYKGSGTFMNFIFIFIREDDASYSPENSEIPLQCFPIFRVPKNSSSWEPLFIDLECRVYKSWGDFLKNNQLPPCVYCYPEDGKYTFDSEGNVKVCFDFSPSSSLSTKFLRVADTTSTTVGVPATLSLPVPAPILAAVLIGGLCASVYSAVRSVTSLWERSKHNQSISPSDPEARNFWISTVGCTVGAAATGALMAGLGRERKGIRNTVTALNGAALSFGSFHIVNGAFNLVKNYKDVNLTTMDATIFSENLFLLYNASVNFRTAQSIVNNTQNRDIQDFKERMQSNRHRKVFSKLEKNTYSNLGQGQGCAQVIRTINTIENFDDFMAGVVQTDEQMRYTRSRGVFHDGGRILYNNKVSMDPTQLARASAEQRVAILRASQRFSSARLSEARFSTITREFFANLPSETINVNAHQTNLPANFRYTTNHNRTIQLVDNVLSNLAIILTTIEKQTLDGILAHIPEILKKHILKTVRLLLKAVNCFILILRHISKNKNLLVQIYNYVSDLIKQIVEMWKFPSCIREQTYIHVEDFIPLCNIILNKYEGTHQIITELAKKFLEIVGYTKIITLINTMGKLFLCVQEGLDQMEILIAKLKVSLFDENKLVQY